MSLLSYYFKTFNYPTTFSHCKSYHCHTAAFCQKIILEFVARCRWNGKKYFWATLLNTTLKTFDPTSVKLPHFAGKKIISHFKTTELTLVCDRSTFLNSAKSYLFKHVQTCLCHYWFAYYSNSFRSTFASLVLTIIQRNISDLKSRNLDNTHRFFLVSSIPKTKWVRGSNPGWEKDGIPKS